MFNVTKISGCVRDLVLRKKEHESGEYKSIYPIIAYADWAWNIQNRTVRKNNRCS